MRDTNHKGRNLRSPMTKPSVASGQSFMAVASVRASLWFASASYIGLIPGAPGTYASVATSLLFFAASRVVHGIVPELHLTIICLTTALGILASAKVSRTYGVSDPQQVVIDEVAGQLVTFLVLPASTSNILLGTVLFRAFDILKPFPIRRLEPIGNGVGIMADDLLAGVYANLCLQAVSRLPQINS